MDIRSLQKPLKEQYRNDPKTSKSQSVRKADRRMCRWHAPSILDVPSTKPKRTGELEGPAPALPVTFCLGPWLNRQL